MLTALNPMCRYALNTPLYATAVTLSAISSLLTIPFLFNYLR